jgi:hypothetical protein
MADRPGTCERCGKEYAKISSHRSRNKGLPYCGAPVERLEGDCPKCGKHLKRLDLHLRIFPGDSECKTPARTPTGPTLEEIAKTYPSVLWGQDEWYAILRADNGIFDAILRDMTTQALKHPLGDTYDSKSGWLSAEKESE